MSFEPSILRLFLSLAGIQNYTVEYLEEVWAHTIKFNLPL